MKAAASLVTAALLAAPAAATAQQHEKPTKWTAGVGASYLVLGDKRPTGGLAPQVFVHAPVARGVGHLSIVAGVRATAFNFSSWYWMAALVGPEVGMTFPLPLVPDSWGLYGTALVGLDLGQYPMVTNWGWPGRVWGTQARVAPGIAYEPTRGTSVRASLGVRHVNSPMNAGFSGLARHGIAFDPQVSAVFGWGD